MIKMIGIKKLVHNYLFLVCIHKKDLKLERIFMPKPLATITCDWNLSYSPEYINNHNNYLPINHVMVCVLVATKNIVSFFSSNLSSTQNL